MKKICDFHGGMTLGTRHGGYSILETDGRPLCSCNTIRYLQLTVCRWDTHVNEGDLFKLGESYSKNTQIHNSVQKKIHVDGIQRNNTILNLVHAKLKYETGLCIRFDESKFIL